VPKSLKGLLFLFAMISFTSHEVFSQQLVTDSENHQAQLEMRHGIPFVRLMIDGQGPFVFAVDTGTNNQAIVTPDLASKLQLKVVARRNLTDLSGQHPQTVSEVAMDSISLAGVEFRGIRAVVHSTVDHEGAYDGILGFALFRNVLLTLDFPHRRLELSQAVLSPRSDEVVPMRLWQGVPALFLQLGDAQLEAQIDTGTTALSLPESVANTQKFRGGLEVYGRGSSQVQSWLLRGGTLKGSVEMAGYVFRNPFVEVSERFPVANLGTAPLQNFVLQFDQRSKLIGLRAENPSQRLDRASLEMSIAPPAGTAMMGGSTYSGGF
jgi:predicted aspartyl protease